MDINTPAMNGLAAIIEYGGRWAHNSDAPVIGLSASTGKDHQETGFAAAPHRQREFDLRETEGFFGCARGRVIALDHLGQRPLRSCWSHAAKQCRPPLGAQSRQRKY